MGLFGKNKGKIPPNTDTRGLSDTHPQPTYRPVNDTSVPLPTSTSLVPVNDHVSSLISSPTTSSSSPPFAVPYVPPKQYNNRGSTEVDFFAGGNENKQGEQEVDDVEIGNSSNNGVVSPLFADGGKFDIKVGNNKNEGLNQKIGKVMFGNVA